MEELTGYGSVDTCTLCNSADAYDNDYFCKYCIHGYDVDEDNDWENDMPCTHDTTFKAIAYAGEPYILKKAMQERATYLSKRLKAYNSYIKGVPHETAER